MDKKLSGYMENLRRKVKDAIQNPHLLSIAMQYRLSGLLSPLISVFESIFYEKYGIFEERFPCIFIIGAPRTGSTITYEFLTNELDLLYVDNLVCRFYKNFFFGFFLSNLLFGNKPHNCFSSDYGNTEKFGLHAPSECGNFWYRWLPTEYHFIDHKDITANMINEIGKEIRTVINFFEKPLIFKNLNAGMRIRLISKIFKNAKYIVVNRNPSDVAISIFRARKKFSQNKWWSIMPPNYRELMRYPIWAQAVLQVYFINKQIFHDLEKYSDPENWIKINYEEFIKNPHETLNLLEKFIGYNKKRNDKVAQIKIEKPKTSVIYEDEQKIKKLSESLDWEKYSMDLKQISEIIDTIR